jgi:hypothetical protein
MSAPFLAFLQTTGLVLYIILVSSFFNFVIIPFVPEPNPFYIPIIMLLVFVFSAVISSILILGRAGMLFWEKKYRESLTLVSWTVGWGFLYLLLLILFLSWK